MTTIIWQPGVLVVDKCVTVDNVVAGNGALKAVVTDETVYAVCGTLVRGLRFIRWLKVGKKRRGKGPRLKGTEVIEYDRATGKAKLWESRHIALPLKGVYTTGSGGQLALGALEAGATAEEAMRVASKYDAYTGHGVQIWRVSDE